MEVISWHLFLTFYFNIILDCKLVNRKAHGNKNLLDLRDQHSMHFCALLANKYCSSLLGLSSPLLTVRLLDFKPGVPLFSFSSYLIIVNECENIFVICFKQIGLLFHGRIHKCDHLRYLMKTSPSEPCHESYVWYMMVASSLDPYLETCWSLPAVHSGES